MPTINAARDSIYSRMISEAIVAAANLTLENEQYDPPETSWIRLVVRNRDSQQETMGPVGGREYRRFASAMFQIFTPIDGGMKAGDDLAQSVRESFEGTSFGSLRVMDAIVREVGVDGRWHQTSVEVEFDYHERR